MEKVQQNIAAAGREQWRFSVRTLKKLMLYSVVLLFASCSFSPIHARERNKGYQGSVSYSNMALLWNGIEAVHGYMFDGHHFLGAGAGISTVIPFSEPYGFIGHFFVDYHAYWFDRKSTPTAGIKVGYICSFPDGDNLRNVEIEPNIGWSWLLRSGNALALSLGASIVPEAVSFTETSSFPVTILPCLRFGFEF